MKSPPELWAELSDPAALERHLGELGEIRITRLEPESEVHWEAERTKGTVLIKPSAWGTKVTLSVIRELAATKVEDRGAASASQAEGDATSPPARITTPIAQPTTALHTDQLTPHASVRTPVAAPAPSTPNSEDRATPPVRPLTQATPASLHTPAPTSAPLHSPVPTSEPLHSPAARPEPLHSPAKAPDAPHVRASTSQPRPAPPAVPEPTATAARAAKPASLPNTQPVADADSLEEGAPTRRGLFARLFGGWRKQSAAREVESQALEDGAPDAHAHAPAPAASEDQEPPLTAIEALKARFETPRAELGELGERGYVHPTAPQPPAVAYAAADRPDQQAQDSQAAAGRPRVAAEEELPTHESLATDGCPTSGDDVTAEDELTADDELLAHDALPASADRNAGAAAVAPADLTVSSLGAEPREVELAAAEEVKALLTAMLDRLGAAHHRPFSRA